MSSREELWRRFGQPWGWPPEDLTVEQDRLWVRASAAGTGLEEQLDQTVRRWVADRWPFRRVASPGGEP